MAILIDASVFIAIERNNYGFMHLSKIWAEDDFAIAASTVSELLSGALRANSNMRRTRRLAFVEFVGFVEDQTNGSAERRH